MRIRYCFRWQNLDTSWRNRKLFNLEGDLASGKEAGVFENKPTESTDEITKSGALYDEVMTRQGLAKMMSKKFLDQDFWNPKVKSFYETTKYSKLLRGVLKSLKIFPLNNIIPYL